MATCCAAGRIYYGLGGDHADAFADAIGKKTAIVYLRASAIGLVPPALLRHGYWAFGLNIELASVSVVTAARKRSGGRRMPQYGHGRAAARGQQGKKRVRQADGSTGGGAGRAGGWWPYIQCGGARTGAPGVGEEGSRKVQALLPAVGRSRSGSDGR